MKNFILKIKQHLTYNAVEIATTLIIGILIFTGFLIINILSSETSDSFILIIVLGLIDVFVIFSLVYLFFCKPKVPEVTKSDFISTLIFDTEIYIEFEYIPSIKGDEKNMILEILNSEGCKFYAKLIDNQNIHLNVVNKHDETVYCTTVKDYRYFNSIFKNIDEQK